MPYTVRDTCAEPVFHEQTALSIFRWHLWTPTMESTSRLFFCARCRGQVLICSRCDRGQLYCSDSCSKTARDQSVRAAGRRYQRSRPGRFKHAERTRRYRLRQQNVTHQGSEPSARNDLLTANSTTVGESDAPDRQGARAEAFRCSFCGRDCSAFVRYGFLHSRRVPPIIHLDRIGTQHGHYC